MSNCLNCPHSNLSFSKAYSELQFSMTNSVKVYCSKLDQIVYNGEDPRTSFPIPDNCPVKDEVKDKTMKDWISDSFKQ